MLKQNVNKFLVKKRFCRSLYTYRKNAPVQEYIAKKFVGELKKYTNFESKKILEIGAGTGFLSEILIASCKNCTYIINDLVEESEKILRNLFLNEDKNLIKYLTGDAELIQFPDNIDIIASTSTFQWFNDLEKFLKRISENINKEGILAFSTFGNKNLYQLRMLTDEGLEYPKTEDFKILLNEQWDILHCLAEEIDCFFDTPDEILKHLKKTGVNSVSSQNWTVGKMKNFIYDYKQLFSENNKVRLTYNPIYIVAKKK